MDKCHHIKYRYGFTGTLDGTQTHKWVLEGLFGPSYKVTGTKKLIDEGHSGHTGYQVSCTQTYTKEVRCL